MHFDESERTSRTHCFFCRAVKADLIHMVSKEKSEKKMPKFMNGCANQIKKIHNKESAFFAGKILKSGMPGLPHDKSKKNQNKEQF